MAAQAVDIDALGEVREQILALVARAAAGEEVVLSRAGEPLARIVPYAMAKAPRRPGALRGEIWIADDFDELPPDVARDFGIGDE